MRLASKIFLTASLVIVVLGGVGVLSLRAVDRLVTVNREVTTRAVPALALAVAAREAVPPLVRLEARLVVLRDPRYVALWEGQAARVAQDLERLGDYATSAREAGALAAARAAFAGYRSAAGRAQALLGRGDAARALVVSEREARGFAERVESRLEALREATRARALAAQAEAARLEARTWTGVLVAFGAAVGLALLGTAVVAQRMTRPLGALSAATAAVAAGAWQAPIAVRSRDEIGRLAESFNAMAGELRRLEETKREFFATVSHELRSPLTSIRGAVDLLRDRVPGDLTPAQARLVDITGQSTDRLLRLVNRILEVARLSAGAATLERTALDLDKLAARAVDELRPQAEDAGVALAYERVGDDFALAGDEERLFQVVVNLGTNAIRFTPRGGRVAVGLAAGPSGLELAVEDTGAGIPAAVLPRIFDAWRQAHAGHGGTGLGLALVRGVVEAHGGRVAVASEEGKGSRFTVHLPRA
ncbi:MAG: HAMP domain-containing histidine kinase [Candidatus Rokubacteria bacterium]|nr:HAMP domain-containing histidine kinase [Candidatus Rokubacteria bacterium]